MTTSDTSPGPAITIIGAGHMAEAIGGLAVRAGHALEIASRDATRARALAERIGGGARTGAYGAAPAGELVLLAVPYAVVLDVVAAYGDALAGTVLVDLTNPADADLTGFVTPDDSSAAQEIARAAPHDAVVVKAFNTQFSHVLATGAVEGHPLDVFLAGDDVAAKARVSAFVESLGLRPADAGGLAMARSLEHGALLTLGLVAHALHHTDFSLGVSHLG